MPEIAGKLVIKDGKNAGKHPSVASVYRALAEAEEAGCPGPFGAWTADPLPDGPDTEDAGTADQGDAR